MACHTWHIVRMYNPKTNYNPMDFKNTALTGCYSAIAIFIIACVSLYYFMSYDQRIAQNPKKIAAVAGLELPDYVVVEQTDNMVRPSSAWSDYQWTLRLIEPLTENQIQHLNTLVVKDHHRSYLPAERVYVYDSTDTPGDNESPSITIRIGTDGKVWMEYMWWDFFS